MKTNDRVVYRACDFLFIKKIGDGKVLLRNKKVLRNTVEAPAAHVSRFKEEYIPNWRR